MDRTSVSRAEGVRTLVAAALLMVVIGGAAGWYGSRYVWHGPYRPFVVEGVATAVNADGTAIGLKEDGSAVGEGYDVGSAEGRECLRPLESGQRVRLGVVRVYTDPESSGWRELAVWVRCLD